MFFQVAGHASLVVDSPLVSVGEAAVLTWYSNRGYEANPASGSDWVGIYRKGDCAEPEWWQDSSEPYEAKRRPVEEAQPMERHQCYLEMFNLPAGETSGQLRFKLEVAGDYEARYFKGDSRHGQGYVCRRLPGTGANTYMHCVLEASAVSETISVTGGGGGMPTSFGSTPGLEAINVPYMY